MPDLIEYGSILLESFLKISFVSTGCDDVNLVAFACELLTGDIFHDMLYYGWLFSPNDENTNIGYLSYRELYVIRTIVI